MSKSIESRHGHASGVSKSVCIEIRRLYSFSQSELAAVLDLHPMSVSKVERGASVLSDKSMRWLEVMLLAVKGMTYWEKHMVGREVRGGNIDKARLMILEKWYGGSAWQE